MVVRSAPEHHLLDRLILLANRHIVTYTGRSGRKGGKGGGVVEWWRWGRIELPVQNRVPGNVLQVYPAYLALRYRAPDRRGAPFAIRRASRLFDATHRSRRRRTSPDDIFAARGGGTTSMLTV